tara:strand:- start:606 stop:1166 length:561 start_codon:yes stop_codon:yes gene_type:complete
MVEIILVCTGNKFEEWYVDNIIYMIEKYGKLNYEKYHVIREGEGSYYDKLTMFKHFTDDINYLYFDLDIIIKNNIDHLVKDNFTTLHAWWRPALHTPLNSSIMSWKGNLSHIYDKFYEDEDYSRVKYWRGIDEYLYKDIKPNLYDKVCWSWAWNKKELDYSICLFNHNQHLEMRKIEWTQKYLLSE